MSVQEIEDAIVALPSEELSELVEWLAEYHAKIWDQQIEDDLNDGRLDGLLSEVDAEHEAGLAQPL